jgi:hypothetical protein
VVEDVRYVLELESSRRYQATSRAGSPSSRPSKPRKHSRLRTALAVHRLPVNACEASSVELGILPLLRLDVLRILATWCLSVTTLRPLRLVTSIKGMVIMIHDR